MTVSCGLSMVTHLGRPESTMIAVNPVTPPSINECKINIHCIILFGDCDKNCGIRLIRCWFILCLRLFMTVFFEKLVCRVVRLFLLVVFSTTIVVMVKFHSRNLTKTRTPGFTVVWFYLKKFWTLDAWLFFVLVLTKTIVNLMFLFLPLACVLDTSERPKQFWSQ